MQHMKNKRKILNKIMKGGEKKMVITEKEIKVFCDKCPECNKEICGSTINEINHNMRVHIFSKHNPEMRPSNQSENVKN